MFDEVEEWVRKEKLIAKGDMVLAGVSGGADSVCLLLVLLFLQKRLQFSLQVLHVEHGIRGKESREDAAFVEKLCEAQAQKIPCEVVSVDVPSYAKKQGIGLEEAARLLRYACFEQAAQRLLKEGKEAGEKSATVKIALAHHADDNAETILFQMVRGSGIRGLSGMRAKRSLFPRAEIIRPLLHVTRSEIETFLAEQEQSYCVDATNLDMDYSRNRIRHAVIPQLKQINKQALAHISQSAGYLQEMTDYLEMQVQKNLPQICEKEERGYLIKQELFLAQPLILQREMILEILGRTASSRKDISAVHVESVLALFPSQVGRGISLPYQMQAKRVYEGVSVFIGENETVAVQECYEFTKEALASLRKGEKISICLPDGEISAQIIDYCGEIPKKKYTKWLDYDKMKCGLQIRKRASQDYLVIDEMGHRKKIKEYMIAEKIPAKERNALWLVADKSHVVWVIGGRIGADYKITNHTKRILEIQITGGNYNEN